VAHYEVRVGKTKVCLDDISERRLAFTLPGWDSTPRCLSPLLS